MARKIFGPGLAQPFQDANGNDFDEVRISSAILTAGGANATAAVKAKGGASELSLASPANDMKEVWAKKDQFHVVGPVTIDVVGAGAVLRVDF